MNSNKTNSNWKAYLLLTAIILGVIGYSAYWYIDYSKYIKTDDASLASDNSSVSAKILGRISRLYVSEGDSVKQGQLLAELDSLDLLAQKRQMIAARTQTEAAKDQAVARYQYDEKNIQVLRIALEKAKDDMERAQAQFVGQVMTKEQFEHVQKAEETAQAQLEAAQAQLVVSKTQIKSAETAISSAQAQIDVMITQLRNTRLYAPVGGVVAKRWLLPGDMTQPGQSIYTINNNQKFWILVYLEETKMEAIHIGQKAKFSLDTYSGIVFTGKVFDIGATTASQFSLIPSNNASGNFTKVTQRVPLKISIDETETGQEISSFRFLSGMSAVVKIIKE